MKDETIHRRSAARAPRSAALFGLPAAVYTSTALGQLGRAMAAATLPASKIPSGYVYLGQFIAHDLSRLDPHQGSVGCVEDLIQLRTPALNLENVYGQGFDDPAIAVDGETGLMQLGRTEGDACAVSTWNDLPRRDESIAKIPDDRDDENLLVAQLHVAFLKLHNLFCSRIRQQGVVDPERLFQAARHQLILHYQEVVLYDFLNLFIEPRLWKSVVFDRQSRLWSPSFTRPAQMPVEFAAAAFRFGHSMVRQHYTLDERLPLVDLQTLFALTGHGRMGGAGGTVPQSHVIDWRLFFPFDREHEPRFMNFGMRIDPAVSIKAPGHADPLIAKTLQTGVRCLLPSAQSIVRHLQAQPDLAIRMLTATELNPEVHVIAGCNVRRSRLLDLVESSHDFARDTPLAYYLLAEAHVYCDGLRLGPLGGRIVAEVLLALVASSTPSIMFHQRDERLVQATGRLPGLDRPYLRMSDLLRAIA